MSRRSSRMRSDEELLACRDWANFTDKELKRAVTLSRWQGRKAFLKRRQQVADGADWSLMEEKAHLVMYLAYAAFQHEGQDMSDWDGCQYIDSINDPRIYEFCATYDTYQRRFLGLPALRKNRRLLLQLMERRVRDVVASERCIQSNRSEFARNDIDWQQMNQPVMDALMKGHMQLLHEFLLYRMLLNASTGEWLRK